MVFVRLSNVTLGYSGFRLTNLIAFNIAQNI